MLNVVQTRADMRDCCLNKMQSKSSLFPFCVASCLIPLKSHVKLFYLPCFWEVPSKLTCLVVTKYKYITQDKHTHITQTDRCIPHPDPEAQTRCLDTDQCFVSMFESTAFMLWFSQHQSASDASISIPDWVLLRSIKQLQMSALPKPALLP